MLYIFFDFDFFLSLSSLPPQIAALQKGGDSFPLTAASGKVLGKVQQRTDIHKKTKKNTIETNTLNRGVVFVAAAAAADYRGTPTALQAERSQTCVTITVAQRERGAEGET